MYTETKKKIFMIFSGYVKYFGRIELLYLPHMVTSLYAKQKLIWYNLRPNHYLHHFLWSSSIDFVNQMDLF